MIPIYANAVEWSKLFHEGNVDESAISVATTRDELKLILLLVSRFVLQNDTTMSEETYKKVTRLHDDVLKLLKQMSPE